MNIELSRIDICEICRESILDFYEIPFATFQTDVDNLLLKSHNTYNTEHINFPESRFLFW